MNSWVVELYYHLGQCQQNPSDVRSQGNNYKCPRSLAASSLPGNINNQAKTQLRSSISRSCSKRPFVWKNNENFIINCLRGIQHDGSKEPQPQFVFKSVRSVSWFAFLSCFTWDCSFLCKKTNIVTYLRRLFMLDKFCSIT